MFRKIIPAKNTYTTILIIFLSQIFSAALAEQPSIDLKLNAKNLFIFTANGIRYKDALGNATHLYTENIWTKLRPLGTICSNIHNIELTYPIAAQASLLTGVWHIQKNPLIDTVRPEFPTLFEYWKKQKPHNICFFKAGKKIYNILAYSQHEEYGRTFAPEFDTLTEGIIDTGSGKNLGDAMKNAVYSEAVSYIFKNHPSFAFINLDSGGSPLTELTAHQCRIKDKKGGCDEEANLLNAYYEFIIILDAIVYDLWKRIQDDDIYRDKSMFIFVSTHGRHTDDFHGFGDNCRGCQQLNCLIIGPGIKKNFISNKKRVLIDLCPTIGAACDVTVPFAKGKIMNEILE